MRTEEISKVPAYRENAEGCISGVKITSEEEIRATSIEGATQEAAIYVLRHDSMDKLRCRLSKRLRVIDQLSCPSDPEEGFIQIRKSEISRSNSLKSSFEL
jgi:hypothetical protein